MVRRIFFILSCFIFVFVLCSSALLANSKRSEPLILNDENINEAGRLIEAGGFPFAVLQVTNPNFINTKSSGELKKYIEEGGTVWFYDSRLAGFFGMKNAPMKIKGLETKGMEAEYGSGKMTGAAVGAAAVKGSPIKGVRRAAVFVILLSEDTYSAVENTEGIIPLLKVPNSKSLVGAVIRIGKGKAIFKPLLWESQYDGAAFQRNIIRYSIRKTDK